MNASALFDNVADAVSFVAWVTFFDIGFRVSRSDVPVCRDLPNFLVMSDSESMRETDVVDAVVVKVNLVEDV